MQYFQGIKSIKKDVFAQSIHLSVNFSHSVFTRMIFSPAYRWALRTYCVFATAAITMTGCIKDEGTGAVPDRVAPTVSILFPASDITVKTDTSYTLIAAASDNIKVTCVQFYLNGTLASIDSSAPYTYPCQFMNGIGNQILVVLALDADGNIGRSAEIVLYPDGLSLSGIDMVRVPGGSFLMGSELDSSELPIHRVTLSPFRMGKHEVTLEQWNDVHAWGRKNGYTDLNIDTSRIKPFHPIALLSWYDAVKWCNARSEKYGLTPVYYTDSTWTVPYRTGIVVLRNSYVRWNANGFRLPTESEWEFAARGGTLTKHYLFSGSNDLNMVAWNFNNTIERSMPTGLLQPNELGIHDMSGNVTEWCWDFYKRYSAVEQTDPHGPDSTALYYRLLRGGAARGSGEGVREDKVTLCRVAYRGITLGPIARSLFVGFRVVRRGNYDWQ